MLHFARWKIIAIGATCLFSLLFALPNFFARETVAAWPSWMRKQLALGLDLRGGAHLLLEMDVAEVRKDWLDGVRDEARRRLREAKLGFTGLGVVNNAVQVRLLDQTQMETALRELRLLSQPLGNPLLGTSGLDLDVKSGDGGLVTITPTELGLQLRITNAIGAAIEIVRRRVDNLGTSEASVVRQGRDRILVQFPGLQDTTELKRLIGETARLSFHDVHPETYIQPGRPAPTGFRAIASDEGAQLYLLRESPVVRGDDLTDATPGFDPRTNEPVINFRFNNSGARKFGKFTSENVGRPFAIVLDNGEVRPGQRDIKVLSAPVIREAILGGTGQISGSFTVESASRLAVQIRSGALPAKLTIVEERSVGPSLGADSVAAGTTAFVIGCLATIALTIVAYGTFGIFAALALMINGLMIVAVMSLVGTTLTLPGIAGLVLTIGMAVDANVLIYERIREELRAGRNAVSAIEAGFSRAIVTIADSQLTTLAAALIMFWLGSGPIRGFAVTLSIGIFTSVFTAVTVTRMLVALWLKAASRKSRNVSVPI